MQRSNPDGLARSRRSYVPRIATVADLTIYPDAKVEAWTYRYPSQRSAAGEGFGAVLFVGRSAKPLFNRIYHRAADRDQDVARAVASLRAREERKAAEAAARKAWRHDYQVGEVLVCSWGYEQTNVDFYEVVATTERSITVRGIGQRMVSSAANYDMVEPTRGTFHGAAHRCIPSPNGVKVDDHYARRWKGAAVYQTASGWGH